MSSGGSERQSGGVQILMLSTSSGPPGTSPPRAATQPPRLPGPRGRRSVFQEGIWRKREQKRELERERERGRGGREREWETFSQEFKSSWLVVQQAEEQAAEISLVHHSDHPVSRCAQRVSIDRATPSRAQALSFSLTGVCLRPLEVGGSRLRCDSRRALSAASRGDAVAMVAQLERANGESMTRNI